MINQDRLLDTFLELVRINSPARHEGAVADVIEARLKALGFDTTRDGTGAVIGGETGSIIARRPGETGAEPVFLNAHMDTVQPTDGIRVIIEDGVVKTDGTTILGADDKAGVTAILEAVESALEDGVPLPLLEVIITVAEEVGLFGGRYFDESLVRARRGWVLDSGKPINRIVVQAPAQDKMRFVIHGKAAHAGARPEQGINAITVACRAIAAMPQGRIDEETTANVGVIEGGQATNIVPDLCRFEAEARSHDSGKLARQTEAMCAAVRKAAEEAGATADIAVERVFDAFNVPATAPTVELACRAMAANGLEAETESGGGGSDANYFNRKGMECVILGVGYEDIHTTSEKMTISELVKATGTVEHLLRLAGEA